MNLKSERQRLYDERLKAVERIRARRIERGISRAILAQAAGITPTYLYQLETGDRLNPSHDVVTALESALKQLAGGRARHKRGN